MTTIPHLHLHWEDYEPDIEGFEEPERPRDAMVDTAKEVLRQFFESEPEQVFYKRDGTPLFQNGQDKFKVKGWATRPVRYATFNTFPRVK